MGLWISVKYRVLEYWSNGVEECQLAHIRTLLSFEPPPASLDADRNGAEIPIGSESFRR